jgi:hypothetical protein
MFQYLHIDFISAFRPFALIDANPEAAASVKTPKNGFL